MHRSSRVRGSPTDAAALRAPAARAGWACSTSSAMPAFNPVKIDVPTGDHAAIEGSSVSWNSARPRRHVRSGAFNVISEYWCAEHEHEVMAGEMRDDATAIRRQESGEQRMVLGKAVAARHRTDPHRSAMPFGERNGFGPGTVARHRGADDDHWTARRGSTRRRIPAAVRLAANRSANCARLTGSHGRSQSSTGTETNVGPHGACIAT